MNLLLLVHEKNGCDYHRIVLPFRYLDIEKGEGFKTITSKEHIKPDDLLNCNIMMFNRHPNYNVADILERKRKYGFKLLVDVDDWWIIYPHHPQYGAWMKAGTKFKITECIKNADLVTVTNNRLLSKVRDLNKNVEIVPNGLPFGYEQFVPNRVGSEYIRYIIAGGISHLYDVKRLSEFVLKTEEDSSLNKTSSFILAGYNPAKESGNLSSTWNLINDMLNKLPNYTTRGEMSLDTYMGHYNHADVLMAPLEDIRFNQMKSNLKTIEAGCMKMPIIVHYQYPYIEDIEMKDKGIVFAKDNSEWYAAVKMFERNPNMIRDYGERLHEYVKEKYNLLEINKKRRQIIDYLKSK